MRTGRIALMTMGGLLLAGLLAPPAGAQSFYGGGYGYGRGHFPGGGQGRIDRRQEFQERRIQQGIANGSLTPREAAFLQREQAQIARLEDRALADGRLSPRERFRIEQAQDRAAQDIYRFTHNPYSRYHGPYNGYGPGYYGYGR